MSLLLCDRPVALLTLYRPSPPSRDGAAGRRWPRAPPSVQKGRLLEGAVDDRRRIELQPLVEDRRVDAAEVHIRVQIALNQVLRLARGHLAVVPALDLLAEHKGDAAGAVIGARAVVADAAAE